MPETFKLEIVTPDRMLVNEQAEGMQLPGKNGYLGILPGHAPLITELAVGEISYGKAGRSQHLAVAWGFAEVLPDKVTVLAEIAERAEEIDVNRAREAKDRAQARLQKMDTETDYQRAELALEKAITRLEVARKK